MLLTNNSRLLINKLYKMEIKQIINELLKGKVAVNCRTERDADDFLYVLKKEYNVEFYLEPKRNNYIKFEENTCYEIDTLCGGMTLLFDNKEYFEKTGYEIITLGEL